VPNQVSVRRTAVPDRAEVIELVRAAFSDDTRDASEEVAIVTDTWALGNAVRPIDLVAIEDGVIVGHVLAAEGDLGGRSVIGVAPLAVAPAHQRRGIGSSLMRELLQLADHEGWPMALLLGDPAYYHRFGFEPTGPLDIVYPPVGEGNPHFQARCLSSYHSSCRGTFRYCWEQL
jgi:predicted N-acetyltransferase YhbS